MSIFYLPFYQILPEIGGSRDGWSEAMAASALDPHILVRLDSKSIPRSRSFRERGRGAFLCVSDACADHCALVPALTMSTAAWIRFARHHPEACWHARTDSLSHAAGRVQQARERWTFCARPMRARACELVRGPIMFSRDCSSNATFHIASRRRPARCGQGSACRGEG